MKRKRIPIIDEMMESCRLMPTWIQSMFFLLILGIATFLVPILFYSFWGVIITIQLIFIILLVQKNIVYRRISKIETSVNKMVTWVHTKRDENEKYKKGLVNLALVVFTLFLFYELQDSKLLLINSLFCVLFFLKLAFYVPLISVRIVEDDRDINKFMVIDKALRINTEIYLFQINSMEVTSKNIVADTKEGQVEISLGLISNQEVSKLKEFLKKINKFEIK